jgi:hypothetical protein
MKNGVVTGSAEIRPRNSLPGKILGYRQNQELSSIVKSHDLGVRLPSGRANLAGFYPPPIAEL